MPVKLLKTTVVAGNATHDQSLIPVATEWRVGVIKGKGKTGEKEGWVRPREGERRNKLSLSFLHLFPTWAVVIIMRECHHKRASTRA